MTITPVEACGCCDGGGRFHPPGPVQPSGAVERGLPHRHLGRLSRQPDRRAVERDAAGAVEAADARRQRLHDRPDRRLRLQR